MSEPENNTPQPSQPQAPKKKRKIGRWIFLLFVVALLCSYQPILARLIPFVARRVAAAFHVKLNFTMSGNFFSTLEIDRLTAIGDAQSVIVRNVRIEKLALRYSIPALIKKGLPAFAQSIQAANCHVELTLPDDHQPPDITKNLRIGLTIPLLLGEHLDGKNINIILHTDDGDFILRDGFVNVAPAKSGYVSISQLSIQNGPTFYNLNATGKIANRHAIIDNLALNSQFFIAHGDLALNANDPKNALILALRGRCIGGDATLDFTLDETVARRSTINATLANASLTAISQFRKITPALSGTIPKIVIAISGDIDHPKTWNGSGSASLADFANGELKIDRGTSHISVQNGRATLDAFEIDRGKNRLIGTATSELPKTVLDLPSAQIQGSASIDAPELHTLFSKIADGAFASHIAFSLAHRELKMAVSGSATQLAADNFKLDSATWKIDAAQHFPENPKPNESLVNRLAMTVSGNFQNLTAAQTLITSGTFSATFANRQLDLATSEIARGDNTLALKATAKIPDNPHDWQRISFHTQLDLHAPNLEQIQENPALQNAHGSLELHADIARADDRFNGSITASGSDFKINELAAQTLDFAARIKDNAAQIDRFQFVIDNANEMTVSGSAQLAAPFDYAGNLALHLDNLAFLNPLLKALEKPQIGGALDLDWSGTGNFANRLHNGTLALAIRKFQSEKFAVSDAAIAGHYAQDDFEFPSFHIASGESSLKGSVEIREGKLRLHDLLFTQKGAAVLSGFAFIPFDIEHPAALFPHDQRIAANINATDLNIDKLAADFRLKSPVSGSISANLTIGGTFYEPDGNLRIFGKSLLLKSQPKLAATDLDATLNFQQPTLTLDAVVKQRDLQPLTIKGSIPLDIQKIAVSGSFDLATPLAVSFDLPRTSLSFVNRLSTDIRYVDGFAEAHCKLGGTIKAPELSGNVSLNLAALRFKQPDAPTFNDFHNELHFVNNRLQITECRGTISGGQLAVSGGIDFRNLLKPDLNLQIHTQNVLLARNETITVRANSDIKIVGPLNTAKVTGSVDLVNSRFFRDIDILPIQLPQRPAPTLPEPSRRISITAPPIRGWTFHVAIRTKDPFQIRSNLANGNAIANLTLLGSGLAPTLDGSVTIDNLYASLPFSRLRVSHGAITFSPNNPFVPKLDIRGESQMQDYNISVYIYGSAENPQTVFSSEPPLPQEDIISLIATGATTQDLAGNSDVLAGRAAALLFNKVYHTVFKNRPPPDENSLAGRFHVDVGGVDSRTGHQEVGAQFRLTDHWYLTGDLDVQSDVKGGVKYVIRFR